MARADGKLYELLADHACRVILAALLKGPGAMTQRELVASLSLSSSTISRRMAELEAIGLVEHDSARSPYRVVFEEKTRALMKVALELGSAAAMRESFEADTEARELDEAPAPIEVESANDLGETS
jgi:DNA-binding Lrp family transcriptional regulator